MLQMIMRRLILVAVLCWAGCGCQPSATHFRKSIAQYKGDGEIRDVSQPALVFGTTGYVIQFAKFDLDQAFNKEFRLANVPVIKNSKAEIFLTLEDNEVTDSLDDNLRKQIKASVSVSLVNPEGKVVTQFSERAGDLIWSSPVHGYKGCWLYSETASAFVPRQRESYLLHVEYAPDATLKGKHGRISLYSGCGGS